MHILALETSGDVCSVALLGPHGIAEREDHVPRGHTRALLPMVRDLLDEVDMGIRDLTLIAFGRGPGSFTGVRIAAAAAQGLGLASDVPVMGVSSLAAIAADAGERHGWQRVVAVADARMHEVYLGAYRCDEHGWQLLGAEQVASAETVHLPADGDWTLAGPGVAIYRDVLTSRLGTLIGEDPGARALARHVATLARAGRERGETPLAAAEAQPVYLRDRVAEPARERGSASTTS